jgi:hypothetical protein
LIHAASIQKTSIKSSVMIIKKHQEKNELLLLTLKKDENLKDKKISRTPQSKQIKLIKYSK